MRSWAWQSMFSKTAEWQIDGFKQITLRTQTVADLDTLKYYNHSSQTRYKYRHFYPSGEPDFRVELSIFASRRKLRCHTIQSNIPKVVHDCKFDKLPMFSASGYSADCTELRRVSDELMGSWVLNYGHCPVSSLTPEYWPTDTLG